MQYVMWEGDGIMYPYIVLFFRSKRKAKASSQSRWERRGAPEIDLTNSSASVIENIGGGWILGSRREMTI